MALKILHVLNIAQNAYVNATILRDRGHDCDLLAFDFYHFASSPEWYHLGEAFDPKSLGDDFFPDFYSLSAEMPVVGDWVAQGPLYNCLIYLIFKREGNPLAQTARAALAYLRFKATMLRSTLPAAIRWPEADFLAAIDRCNIPAELRALIVAGRVFDTVVARLDLAFLRWYDSTITSLLTPPFEYASVDGLLPDDDDEARGFLAEMRRAGLSTALGVEIEPPAPGFAPIDPADLPAEPGFFARLAHIWHRLASHYDACLFYGDSCIHALVAGIENYCALEHGTIRELPFLATPYGTLLAAGYQRAAKVFITNTDYLTAGRRLEFRNDQIIFAPHPFDEKPAFAMKATHVPRRRAGEITFLCPARQDWTTRDSQMSKGNDVYFWAARMVIAAGERRLRLRCVDWGVDQKASLRLIEELEIGDFVEWVPPMTKGQLWRAMLDADAVLDQFLISALSGVAFEALALGRRVITFDDGVANLTFFGEQPPILAAATAEEVVARMLEVIGDPLDRQGIGQTGISWVKRHHSGDRITQLQIDAYATLPGVSPSREGITSNHVCSLTESSGGNVSGTR
jgi:glycosyltransferase involved in cell wall biosynthesis